MATTLHPHSPDAWRNCWQRIAAHPFEDPTVGLDFCTRLAREHGWTREEARAVIEEYRRFAFLAVVAGHEVTPSDHVDEVWHLHLTYTRDYWRTWCPEVLGCELHHGPTRGGAENAARYRAQYAETLASYERVFGAPPPARWWPGTHERFRAPQRFQRVDRAQVWVIPRPRFALPQRIAALIGLACALPSPAFALPANPLDWTAAPFLALYGVAMLVSIVGAVLWRRSLRENGSTASATNLDPYGVALLAGGAQRAGDAAIAELLARNAARLDESQQRLVLDARPADLPPPLDMVAKQIQHDGRPDKVILGVARMLGPVRATLERNGLLLDPAQRQRAALLPALLPAAVAVLGVLKIYLGMMRDKPVGFIVVLTILIAIVAVGFAASRPQRSRAGDRALAQLTERHQREVRAPRGTEVALAVALVGTSALAGTAWASYHQLRQPPSSGDGGSSSSDSSSSSSSNNDSGSDGGGSGCGGCGGGGGD
jgi:uncharacterized protein (TIGR04222 family)